MEGYVYFFIMAWVAGVFIAGCFSKELCTKKYKSELTGVSAIVLTWLAMGVFIVLWTMLLTAIYKGLDS